MSDTRDSTGRQQVTGRMIIFSITLGCLCVFATHTFFWQRSVSELETGIDEASEQLQGGLAEVSSRTELVVDAIVLGHAPEDLPEESRDLVETTLANLRSELTEEQWSDPQRRLAIAQAYREEFVLPFRDARDQVEQTFDHDKKKLAFFDPMLLQMLWWAYLLAFGFGCLAGYKLDRVIGKSPQTRNSMA